MIRRSLWSLGTAAAVVLLLLPLTATAQRFGGRGVSVSVGRGGVGVGNYGYGYGRPGYAGYGYGYGNYGWYGNRSYDGAWGYYPSAYSYPTYVSGYGYPAYARSYAYEPSRPYGTTYTSFYPPTSAAPGPYFAPSPAVSSSVVNATIQLPSPDAELWVEGERMSATGATRRFASPQLEPGRTYTYTFKARWTEGDRPVERTKEIDVRPGDNISVDFSKP